MFDDDYIVRQLRVLTESIAKGVGLSGLDDHALAEDDLDDAYRALLPLGRELFEELDARSLLPLLGAPTRIAAIAQLQALEGDVRLAQGRRAQAARCVQRALVFLQSAATTIDVDTHLLGRLRAMAEKP